MNCFAGAAFASRLPPARDYLPEGVASDGASSDQTTAFSPDPSQHPGDPDALAGFLGPPDGSERYNTIFTPMRINVTASTVRSRRSGTWALA